MDNHLITLISMLAQDRVDRAAAELQAAQAFQERVNMFLNGMGSTTSTPEEGTMGGTTDTNKGTTGGVTATAQTSTPKVNSRPAGRKRKGAMIESMIQVMGTEVMTAGDVAKALEAAGLAPESNNLKAYISSVFSSTKGEDGEKLFKTVSRGKYTVAQQSTVNAPIEEQSSTSDAQMYASPADQILAEQGLSVGSFQQPSTHV